MQFFPQRTADLRRYKLLNWTFDLVERIERSFHIAASQAKVAGHHEELHVHHDAEHRRIQLYFGQHPVDISSSPVEHGAALVISQGATGAVSVYLYPDKEGLVSWREKLVVWDVFDDPLELTDRLLVRAITDFTCYARVTNVLDGGTPAEKRRVRKLLKHDRYQSAAKVDTTTHAEEEFRQKREANPSWGARLANNGYFVLFGALGIIITIVTGGRPFMEMTGIAKWLGVGTEISEQKETSAMPVITGWYTFCPEDDSGASPKLLNLLYDIGKNAGTVAFFDVQVGIECVMGNTSGPAAPIVRAVGEHSLSYVFDPTSKNTGDVDGDRTSADLYRYLPESGSSILVLDDRDGRNALTKLGINSEGVDDILYGPYLIKARGEDASLNLELSAPILDTTMQATALKIASKLRADHMNDPPPKGIPDPIVLSDEDLRRFKEQAESLAAMDANSAPPPKKLPPLDPKLLSKFKLPSSATSSPPLAPKQLTDKP